MNSILNRVDQFKSFVYGKVYLMEGGERPTMEVDVRARKNGRPICFGCERLGPGYDPQPERRF